MPPANFTLDHEAREKVVGLFVEVFTKYVVDAEQHFNVEEKRHLIEKALEYPLMRSRPLDELSNLLFQLGEVLGQLHQRFGVNVKERGRRHLYTKLREMLVL